MIRKLKGGTEVLNYHGKKNHNLLYGNGPTQCYYVLPVNKQTSGWLPVKPPKVQNR